MSGLPTATAPSYEGSSAIDADHAWDLGEGMT